jgi:hypothetical protein
MEAPRLATFVQTVPGRELVLAGLEQSLRESDVGEDYTVVEHPPGVSVAEFFLDVLRTMASSDAELLLRLEDDALVNRHLRHNLTHWAPVGDEDFGAGWIYSPALTSCDVTHKRRLRVKPRQRIIGGGVGILFRRSDMPWMIEGCERWFGEKGGDAMDYAVSDAVYRAERQLYLHDPPLVEHRITKSSLGHPMWPSQCTQGAFKLNWRCPA